MRNGLTKGESETAIRNAVIKFEQELMGRGPTEVKAFILRDMVLVRLKGVLKDDVIGELRGKEKSRRRHGMPWLQLLHKNKGKGLDPPVGDDS